MTTSHPAPYTRKVAVYVPKQYVAGTVAPFIVGADGPDQLLFTTLDNLIARKRVPVMVAISIGNGSGDAQGSQRGLEYDTMSGRYAEFVENEVLPLVEEQCHVKLTKDPDARATMGGSSGAAAALIMAWYHPELYHRVLSYSGTYVNQQWPPNPETPHGAWEFHEHLIPNNPAKPIRIWMHVGDRDLFNPNSMRDNMHDWVVANENMAKVLAAKGYHYQFVFVRNAGHTERIVKQQTLPAALREYVWKTYRVDTSRSALTLDNRRSNVAVTLRVVVLGAGFGGLELTTLLSEAFGAAIDIVLIDKGESFVFGFSKLDVMFGRQQPQAVLHAYRDIVKPGVRFVQTVVRSIDPSAKRVETDAGTFDADVLVVALGADLDPASTPGLLEGGHEFYSVPGAFALRDVLPRFERGAAVIGVTGKSFKCPPAPSETALLLHDYLTARRTTRGDRDRPGHAVRHANPAIARHVAGDPGGLRRARDPVRERQSRAVRSTRRNDGWR